MSSNDNRLELQKRLQQRMKNKTDTTSRTIPRTHEQLPHFLQQVLPDNYTYIIKSYKELELENFPGAPTAAFDSTFYVNISSAEAIEEWRTAFHNKTGTIFRITRADKVKGIKVIYHKDFHCRHADIAAIKYMQKTYAQKAGQRRSRNTNCQCLAKIRLEKSRLILSHPCEIRLMYNHNHPLETFNLTPPTPSMVSSTSDESGKSTPQHNLDFDSSDTDYCQEIIGFMENPRRTTFLNQFPWIDPSPLTHLSHEEVNFGQVDTYSNGTFIGYSSQNDSQFQHPFTSPPTTSVPIHFSNEQFLIQPNHAETIDNHNNDSNLSRLSNDIRSTIKRTFGDNLGVHFTTTSVSDQQYLPQPPLGIIDRPSLKRSSTDQQEIIPQFSIHKRRSISAKRPESVISLAQQI
ncbi:4161_t:CDS:2 [Acaulospora colombiana]|uniref:4161_t:CDS:1 n=1 Tax=Acaulospora colombiana TaxID=27376 RepID=A0ACA9K954_9GLOM|nr:4161_t:CDS:2 [Acaulospora colombiana]